MPDDLSLFDVERELVEALAAADADPHDAGLALVVTNYMQGAAQKRDRVCKFLSSLDALESAAEEEISRLQGRLAAVRRKRDRLEQYVVSVMEATGQSRIDGLLHTLSLQANPPSVKITDERLLPAEYVVVEQTKRPDRVAIKSAIKAGKEVPGAELVAGDKRLRRA